MKKFALLAHPTTHSLSPTMWQSAFKELDLPYTYEAIDVDPVKLQETFSILKNKYNGFSVSIPFKEAIIPLLDSISKEVQEIGAVNTIKIEKGRTTGENTDWIGVTKALGKIDDLLSKKVLICGAGGASKSAIYALNTLGIIPYVTNRTKEKAKLLEKQLKVQIVPIYDLPEAHVLINATSIGLEKGDKFPISDDYLSNCSYIFDMVYGDTNLNRRAKKLGVKRIDGREMLVYQGIAQFELLTGHKAPEEAMRKGVA